MSTAVGRHQRRVALDMHSEASTVYIRRAEAGALIRIVGRRILRSDRLDASIDAVEVLEDAPVVFGSCGVEGKFLWKALVGGNGTAQGRVEAVRRDRSRVKGGPYRIVIVLLERGNVVGRVSRLRCAFW